MHMTARQQSQSTVWRKRVALLVTALVVITAVALGAANV